MIQVLEDLHDLLPGVFPEVIEFRGGIYNEFHRRVEDDDWEGVKDEYLVAGPAGTGKTLSLSFFVHDIQKRYPGSKGLVLRALRVDLNDSFMETFEEEVLDPDDPMDRYVLFNGGRKRLNRQARKDYQYPPDPETGAQSKIVLGGMDQWERYRSTRWDWILAIEATEMTKANVMGIQRSMRPQRKRGAQRRMSAGTIPKRLFIMETNPDAPEHHLKLRADRGVCHLIDTTLKDNPTFYDRGLEAYTEAGEEYLARLRRGTSGHVFQRLVNGEWAGAQGGVFDAWERAQHVLHGQIEKGNVEEGDLLVFDTPHPELGEEVEITWYCGGFDIGARNAGCFQVWGFDRQHRAYLVREVYAPERDIEWWAKWCVKLYDQFPMRAIACDHDPYFISRFNEELHKAHEREFGKYRPTLYHGDIHGKDDVTELVRAAALDKELTNGVDRAGRVRIAQRANKRTSKGEDQTNIVMLRTALLPGEDGVPRVMVLNGARFQSRPTNLDVDKPYGLVEEIERAVWARHDEARSNGLPREEIDPKCDDHAIDAASYALAYAWGRDYSKKPTRRMPRPGTWEYEEMKHPGRSIFDDEDDDDMDEREKTWF